MKPPDEVNDVASGSLVALRDRIGPVRKVLTGIAVSGEASRALRSLEIERIGAERQIARTAIAVGTAKVCSALVARSMPQIGALTVKLNAATSAVDATLTSGCAAEVVSHILSRSQNLKEVAGLRANGHIEETEEKALVDMLESDLADDVERARVRKAAAKEGVTKLHAHALGGIAEVEKRLQPFA